MNKILRSLARSFVGYRMYFFLVVCLSFNYKLEAFPTSVFWTTCTTDIVPTGKLNIGLANYFTVFNRRNQLFAPDFGLTYGLFTSRDVSVEVGIDYYAATNYPYFFNFKAGVTQEDVLFDNAPSIAIGMFDIGTKPGSTNYNVVDVIIGKTLKDPLSGRLFLGFYSGSDILGRNPRGFMGAYEYFFCDTCYRDGRAYSKFILLADYASGHNALGGGGVGLQYNFTPDVNFLTGPTFFNDARINGIWKWTIQMNILITMRFLGLPCY